MHQNKPSKRKKGKKVFIKLIVIIIIALYFLSRCFPILGASGVQTYFIEHGRIERIVSVKAFIARDEKVYSSFGQGEVKYFVSHGEKVARGQKLAEIYLDKLDERVRKELEIINNRIENINSRQNNSSIFHRDVERLENEITIVVKNMQEDINKGYFGRIPALEAELQSLLQRKNIIAGDTSFGGKNLNELIERKKSLEDSIRSSLQIIYSEFPGFVALNSDGLEALVNLNTIESFTSSDLEALRSKNVIEAVEANQPIIRIVKNHRWSIFAKLTEEEIEGMVEGRSYQIRRPNEERLYSVVLRKIIEEEDGSIVIFDITEAMEGNLDIRQFYIDIIKESYEGILVPNTSITEIDDTKGVYRVDINGFVRFVPIRLQGQNRHFSVVHSGSFENEQGRQNTVNLFDEIVKNGELVTDGQKIR